MNSKVQFVSVNFNQDSLQEKLQNHPAFKANQQSIITLEGVTQYIPKTSTAQTLKDIKAIVATGSTLLINLRRSGSIGRSRVSQDLSKNSQIGRSSGRTMD